MLCSICVILGGLTIHRNKTKEIVFERGRGTTCNLFLNDTPLEVVSSFKYLGTHLFKNGSWYRTQIRVAQQSALALHNVFIVSNQLELSAMEKCKLFDALVGSILN